MQNPYLLNRLALAAFFVSATYAVLLWPPDILRLLFPIVLHFLFTAQTILFLLPWVVLWPLRGFEIFEKKEYRTEIILLIIIIVLGILNVIFSDNFYKSYNAMTTFLLGGVMALWTSMFLLRDPRHVKMFDWFCCICIAIIASIEIGAYVAKGYSNPYSISIFALNPIPLGTLLILLSPGLVRLLTSGKRRTMIAGWALTCFGFILIVLTEKRGTFLAMIAMGLAWLFFKRTRLHFAIATIIILAALIVPFRGLSTYKSLDQNIPSHFNILHRLELYPFALHIYKKHPVFGIGLRPYTHEKYLSDYQVKLNLMAFPSTVRQIQTFDNMLLTAFVELGTLMTLAYLTLITLIIVKYCRKLQPSAQSLSVDLYRLLVFIGFAVHSMTYDSLLFPSINWLFHVHLGVLAGYSQPTDAAVMADR